MDALEVYNQINAFGRDNGMELKVIRPGHITYTMTVQERHLSSPVAAHGGAIAGLMDGVLGVAALSQAVEDGKLVSTVEFKINYFQPVRPGDVLWGEGKVDYAGKTLLVSTGEIFVTGSARVMVAKGMGTFNSYPMERSKAYQLFQPPASENE